MNINNNQFKVALLNKHKKMQENLDTRIEAEKLTLLPLYYAGYNVGISLTSVYRATLPGIDSVFTIPMRDWNYRAVDVMEALPLLKGVRAVKTASKFMILQVLEDKDSKLYLCGQLRGKSTMVGVRLTPKITAKHFQDIGLARVELRQHTEGLPLGIYLWYAMTGTARLKDFLNLINQ